MIYIYKLHWNLQGRLDERSSEFASLQCLHLRDAKENLHLKSRLQEMNAQNESEKAQVNYYQIIGMFSIFDSKS